MTRSPTTEINPGNYRNMNQVRGTESFMLRRIGERVAKLRPDPRRSEIGMATLDVTVDRGAGHYEFDVSGIIPAFAHHAFDGLHQIVRVDYLDERSSLHNPTPSVTMDWLSAGREEPRRVYDTHQQPKLNCSLWIVRRAVIAAEAVQGFYQ